MTKRIATLAALLALLLLGTAPQASAETDTVTLASSAPQVEYGRTVTLSGEISPPAEAQMVEIRDAADAAVASATTDSNGAFSVVFAPEGTVTLHAVWGSAVSEPVTVSVRAVVGVHLPPTRLFDRVEAKGSVSPVRPDALVEVRLLHRGRIAATHRVRMGPNGGFQASFAIGKPGTYRVRALFSADDLLAGSGSDGPRTTPLPSLRQGAHGRFVELLERRLVNLSYRLAGVDETYDVRTADAVLAFRKVQGMDRIFTVDASVWRRLADPIVPKPRSKTKGFHVEIDQTRQVLFTVRNGTIKAILHVSTGKPSTPTHDGTFHVYRKVTGFVAAMYYPSYFDGNRAMHGYIPVPTYAASHGCVRIPYWNAPWLFRRTPVGTRVIIYH
jgi:peptidoglycan hydrolase-like protein with peptidoglycan-binding domain